MSSSAQHSRPRPRLHRDRDRLDASRERLWTAYSATEPSIRRLRAGVEIMELHHAWFPERLHGSGRDNFGTWPRRAGLEVLFVLAVFGERSVSELADHLRLSLASTRGRLDTLVQARLVEERVVERGSVIDYRLVCLTPLGFECLIRCASAVAPLVDEVMGQQRRRAEWASQFSDRSDMRARREIARILMKAPNARCTRLHQVVGKTPSRKPAPGRGRDAAVCRLRSAAPGSCPAIFRFVHRAPDDRRGLVHLQDLDGAEAEHRKARARPVGSGRALGTRSESYLNLRRRAYDSVRTSRLR